MSNIIDSIQLSGTVYTIQGTGGGGSPTVELTQAEYDALVSAGTVAQDTYYIITDAPEVNPNDYVKKVDNNASGYTDVISPKSRYNYSEAFNDTVYWNAGTYTGSTNNRTIGNGVIYISEYSRTNIYFSAGISNGVVTANTTNNNQYVTIEVVDGELAVTPNEGYCWGELGDSNSGSHNIKKHYSSGQSKNVIENTIYDVLDTRREQIENLRTNMVTDVTASVSDGELRVSGIKTNGSSFSSVILKSSTINYDNGLNVQFSSTTEGQKVLNTGSNAYYDLFNAGYDTTKSYHDLTIVMNSGYTGSHAESTFSFHFLTSDGTTRSGELSFAYNVANNSITWLNEGWGTYVTVTDTLSTDYTIKFTANDGYLICYFGSNNGSIGGVDVTRPYEFVTNLITTTSYIHPGQDIIDDLYANKQDTLSAGTGISIVDNVISATGGGGGKAIEAGRGISVTTGETADTISVSLPISAGTGSNSIAEGDSTTASGESSHAEGYNTIASGMFSHAEGESTKANGQASHAEGYYTIANNKSEHASGQYNFSSKASDTFGDSGNTLFSVGNGTSSSARHNAFEIRQNGDIYLTSGGTDIKLQDHLGGGGSSINVVQTTGSSTTDVMSQDAVTTQLSGYVTTDTEQTISGRKIFTYSSNSAKAIEFKQTSDSAKVGFRVTNSASTNNELAAFEFRPNTYTDSSSVSHPLLYLGHYRNNSAATAGVPQTMIGFRQYDQKGAAAYHYLMPLPAEAKTPFSLTTSFRNYFAPLGFKNGDTMITTDNTGVADFSSVLGGLKLVKITQSAYDALTTKDDNTVYFIGDSTNGYTMKIGSANVN